MYTLPVVQRVRTFHQLFFKTRYLFFRVALLLSFLFFATLNSAQANVTLLELIQKHSSAELFEGSTRYGEIDPSTSAVPVYQGDKRLGFLFLNSELVNSVGYSGKPIHVLVGLDTEGIIKTVRLIKHSEPIVLIGIPESEITQLMDGYIGFDLISFLKKPNDNPRFDAISGATVTIRVIDDSIIRSAIKVARAYGLGGVRSQVAGPKASVNTEQQELKDWTDLVAEKSVTRLKLTAGQIDKAFAGSQLKDGTQSNTIHSDDTFIDLYVAQVSVPSIGVSLLGAAEYQNLTRKLKPGKQAIMVAAKGEYSFKGSGYVRGGIFDRFELVQGDDIIRFRDLHHKKLRKINAEGAPEDFKEVDLFMIPGDSTLDPAKPWKLQLLVGRELEALEKVFRTFHLDYQIPAHYLKFEAAPALSATEIDSVDNYEQPVLWKQLWQDKWLESSILLAALGILTAIFFFQDWLVRRPVWSQRIRTGFLLFTLFGIGFYASAQLSVVNILTVFNALVSGFSWEYFLMEPFIFILWGSVAMALLFWGRGAFCGWLCAFGALQEFITRFAKKVGIPQWVLPWGLHERLWPIKYIIFLILFGVSLHSLELAERLAEVEPFKTVIVLKFIRDWPYVLLALALLAPCLFVERFYCRYLCPLGAALAIPARIRMFDWLKRYRRQCGNPCQVCANECMVQAIHPEGQINPNECLYCLHCQERYYDDQVCPVVVKKRGRLERQQAMSSGNSAELAKQILIDIREEKEGK